MRKIEDAIKEGKTEITISLDLSKTQTPVRLTEEGIRIDEKEVKVKKVKEHDKSCYIVEGEEWIKVQFQGEDTHIIYKLIPTSGKPILQCSGTSMHKKEFVERIEKERLRGNILDAGTGLGYTAIVAAQTADHVMTVEQDHNVLEIAKLNPYSQELFTNEKIIIKESDITTEIKKIPDNTFKAIIFDAGTPRSSGNFFSLENYQQAYRVLKERGRLFHYVPNYHSMRGRDFASEVMNRLKKAGFRFIDKNQERSYIMVKKS